MTDPPASSVAHGRGKGLRSFAREDAPAFRVAVALALLAIALRLFFWIYTGRVWEDALITALHSENFGRGLGLTHFRIGEPPIHGFTSPISVLVPLLADAFHPGWGLILIRLLSSCAAGLSVLMLFAINRQYESLRLPLPLITAVAGYLAIEHHQMLWGVAGMETQLVVLTLLVAFYAIAAVRSPLLLGLALAACMYARPDFAFLVAILGGCLLVRAWRAKQWMPLLQTAAASAVVYGAWIAFTTIYYGSPIPNTIAAKSAGYTLWIAESHDIPDFLQIAWGRLVVGVFGAQSPAFAGHGTGYINIFGSHGGFGGTFLTYVALLLFAIGCFVAVVRKQYDMFPIYAFFIVYSIYYVFFVPILFGWYTVPMNAVLVLLAFKGVRDVLDRTLSDDRATVWPLWAGAIAYLGIFAAVLPLTITAERRIQTLIETPVRKQIGLYLRAKNDRTLTVAGEPLGYVGYYSGLTYYDFPGLASRRVVAFLREHPQAGVGGVMRHFQPDYLVLRKREYDDIIARPGAEWLRGGYVLEHRFRVSEADKRKIMFVEYNTDADYLLFRKKLRSVRGQDLRLPPDGRLSRDGMRPGRDVG